MPARLRIGVIGCGFFARSHLHAWRELPGVEVATVCDADAARARAAAREFAVPGCHADAARMLVSERLDAVDIVTGVDSHRVLVELAARHGAHAICQKPIAPTLGDARAMIAACAAAGTTLAVHENFRFQRAMRALKAELAARDYGRVHFARISFRSHWDVHAGQPYLARAERFIIADLGVHLLDLSRFFLGEPERLACRAQRVDRALAGEDLATIMLGYAGGGAAAVGATAIVDMSYASWRERELFPQALVTLEAEHGTIELGTGFRIVATHRGEVRRRRAAPRRLGWMDERMAPVQDSVLAFQRHWLERLRAGERSETDGEDNLRTATLVEAAYRSAETGSEIRLGDRAMTARSNA